ncbi:NXPE family member 3-like, partial [Mercenaria mercenaria]|uniref:NXPE family member 3-like n=1 Tax=Mercenaria mercenaria TaxID=6596 RepID=UPI00234E6D9F
MPKGRLQKEKCRHKDIYIGDAIRLNVILFDGYGKKKSVGGDHLRARLYSIDKKAFTAGLIRDHENGTYTVHFEALWSGQANIQIELLFPRELIATMLRIRNKRHFRSILAGFQSLNYTEETFCTSDDLALKNETGQTKLCIFSYWNNTIPWYCAKPVTKNLTCNDFVNSTRSWADYTSEINTCEHQLTKRKKINIADIKHITIYSNKSQVIRDQYKSPCSSYNTTKLWFQEKPSGFFYNGRWILRHCK